MVNSRDIKELTPETQAYFDRFVLEAEANGLIYNYHWIVTSTYRDQECQDWLYAQGRYQPGNIVTWTRNSRHTSRRAFDIAVIKKEKGKPDIAIWNVAKADVDEDDLPDYQELAMIGKSIGLECGYFWKGKKQDPVHYELPWRVD